MEPEDQKKQKIGEIKRLIARNELKKALDMTSAWFKSMELQDGLDQLTLLQGHFAKFKQEESLNLLRFDEAVRERLKISNSLLEILNHSKHSVEKTVDSSSKTILFLASNPSNTAQLQLEKEFAIISRKIQDKAHELMLKSEWAVTPALFIEAILKYKPSIIHFSGHGTSTHEPVNRIGARDEIALSYNGNAGLIFNAEAGQSKPVNQESLEYLFSTLTQKIAIETVILNACYSESQALAIGKHVPYVIGMNSAIADDAAIEFSTGFYLTLAAERDIEYAFKIAIGKMMMDHSAEESYKPVLIKDGVPIH